MSQNESDKAEAAERRTQETKGFSQQVRVAGAVPVGDSDIILPHSRRGRINLGDTPQSPGLLFALWTSPSRDTAPAPLPLPPSP